MAGKSSGKHQEKRLSAAGVRTITAAGRYPDGNGLYLVVDKSGAKRWMQRIVIHGRRHDLGLGSASLVGLGEAREQALENRKLARAGGDPLTLKKRPTVLTFEEASKEVIELNAPTWRSHKHGKQWLATLTQYVFPHFGKKRLDLISSADVLAALSPIWTSRPETARRVNQRIKIVLAWGKGQGWRLDNPAEDITKSLPKHDRRQKHREALPYDEVSGAIKAVWDSDAGLATKLAFEFLVLTATRSGETRTATWNEIDVEKAVWTIPADKMKAKKLHRVPLSERCLGILAEAKTIKHPDTDSVFPGTKSGKPLSDMTLSKLLREIGVKAVPHGFRTSFRTWASEQTAYPHQVCEFALAHVIGEKSEAAYHRTDLFEKRQRMMSDWSKYIYKS